MFDLTAHLDILASCQHADGGWGYGPGLAMQPEPTCFAVLALSQESNRYRAALEQGLAALQTCAAADGTYHVSGGGADAVWPTAQVLFVRTILHQSREQLRASARALLSLRSRASLRIDGVEATDVDLDRIGWPWTRGGCCWVEPTAWSCLALRRAGYGDHPRVREGLLMLLDRTHQGGGLNFGERKVLGCDTAPTPGPTALALLALQARADDPRVAASVSYLLSRARIDEDLEHLCWARLALEVYRDQLGVADALAGVEARILAARRVRAVRPWLKSSPMREALTALALTADGRAVFRLEETAVLREEMASIPALAGREPLAEGLIATSSNSAVKGPGRRRLLPPRSIVHIARASSYDADLAAILRQQYEPFRTEVPLAGKRIVLKPNLLEYHCDRVIHTDPRMVAAVIELCRREGAAEVVVAEGSGTWRNMEPLVNASGLGDVLCRYRVPFIDLNHDNPEAMPNRGRLTGLEFLYLPRTVTTADVLISLPKLKTHHWAGATLSLKNLFGIMPGLCYGWPKIELHWRNINSSIIDIALTRTPDLAIVDGIIGMEGDGPLNGTAKPLGVVVMGSDPLAVDATCCRLMRLDPMKIDHLALGYRKQLGLLREVEIRQIGETIDAFSQPFETAPWFDYLRLGLAD